MKTLHAITIICLLQALAACDDGGNKNQNDNNHNLNNTNNQTVPVRDDCTVFLTFPATNELSARVVGSFNAWSVQDGFPMERNGYTWELGLTSNPQDALTGYYLLDPGEHAYKFVLNERLVSGAQ